MDTNDLQVFVDFIDQALNDPEAEFYSRGCNALQNICGQRELMPTSHILSDGLEIGGIQMASGEFGVTWSGACKRLHVAINSGMFADVWNGIYKDKPVAIKALRVYNADDLRIVQKSLCKEVAIWKRLTHPNILPFLGVSTTMFRLCIVSEWMASGNINMYLAQNPDANRVNLSLGVANGLQFLHKSDVVHGNLKGHNILIDDNGRALLAEFGFASIPKNPLSINASLHASARWMAPELLNPDHGDKEALDHPTKTSDIYSFAMVNIEIFSGDIPFCDLRNQAVISRVMAGERPARPDNALERGLSDQMWEMIRVWWHQDPLCRTDMSDVLQNLERVFLGDRREENASQNDVPKVPTGRKAGSNPELLITGNEIVLGAHQW